MKPKSLEIIDIFLSKVKTYLNTQSDSFDRLEVNNGLGGLILFNRLISNDSEKDLTEQYLEKCLELISNSLNQPYLAYDILEFLMLIDELNNRFDMRIDADELKDQLYEICLDKFQQDLRLGNFDPLAGFIKFGYYTLYAGANSRKKSPFDIERIVDAIQETAIIDENNSLYWESKLFADKRIYLGSTHGMSGVLNFLLCLKSSGFAVNNYKYLCKGIISNLFSNVLLNQRHNFPIKLNEIRAEDNVPLNWCYGDLNVLLPILRYAITESDFKAIKKAHLMIDQCLDRIENYEGIFGTNVCYGKAGVIWQLRSLQKIYTNPKIDHIVRKFSIDIISDINEELPFFGFTPPFNGSLRSTSLSFMNGLIGIALTLKFEKEKTYDPFMNKYLLLLE